MGKEWKRNIADRYWATNFKGDLKEQVAGTDRPEERVQKDIESLEKNLVLRDRILKFGGHEVCMPAMEEDIEILLAHGEIWLPKGVLMRRGRACGCHENTARLWAANKDKVTIATGYYLCEDGMWRAHSWCLKANSRGGRVVETTNKAVLYYGVCLDEEESLERYEAAW